MFGQSKEEKNKDIVRRYLEEATKNPNLLDELLAPNYVLYTPDSSEPIRGIDGIKQFLARYHLSFPDLNLAVDEVICEGDKCAARYTVHATHKGEFQGFQPSGKHVMFNGISMIKLQDGRIVEDRYEANLLGLTKQLGTVGEPAGTAR